MYSHKTYYFLALSYLMPERPGEITEENKENDWTTC